MSNTDATAGSTGVINTELPMETRIVTSGSYTYIGEAQPGTADADAAWRIQRIGSTGNTRWANKAATFSNVWDSGASEYASYTYS